MDRRARRSLWLLVALLASLGTRPPDLRAQDAGSLRVALASAIEGFGQSGATWGVYVRSLDADETLYELNADAPLAPASNVKLLTSAAALQVLGPEYRFRTYLVTDGVVRGGTIHGDLVLFGTGDPGISDRFYRRKDEVLHRLIDQLEEAGVHTVTGDVVADASFFPGPLRHQGWDSRDLNEHFTAAVSALSYNENVVSFRISSTGTGAPPRVETVPAPSGLQVVNTAEMVAGRARPRLAILREDPLEPVRIEGRMVVGTRDVWRQMTVSVPARFATEALVHALEERGVTVVGGTRTVAHPHASAVRRVSAPARGRAGARILATHVSRPLRDYLEVVNKESHNLFAELVFRAVGRVAAGAGSFEASARAVKSTLHGIGVDTTGLHQVDGSGLAADNRVTARTFVETIEAMSGSPLWSDYWATLPEAGARRELRRMYRTPAAGNLRAKTGTIERVSALSGLVRSEDGERLAFSVIVNGTRSQTRAKRVENEIGVRLASFQRAPGGVPTIVADAQRPSTGFTAADRHRVTRGENLGAIAVRYGVTLDEILRMNPRLQADRIVAGEWIDIPQRGGSEP